MLSKVNCLLFSLLLILQCGCSIQQFGTTKAGRAYKKEIKAFQKKLNIEYSNSTTSPLLPEDQMNFKRLAYFPIDPSCKVKGQFKRTKDAQPFEMPTTTGETKAYIKYGEIHFMLKETAFQLSVYQSLQLRRMPQYRKHLLLPFTDTTNGISSYGGGRYIDFSIPASTEVVIDFNKAYNPYCAYNSKYSCPIPPATNHLNLAVEAGVKAW